MTQSKYTTQEQIEAMRREILSEKHKLKELSTGKGTSVGRLQKVRWVRKAISGAVFLALCFLIVWTIFSIQLTRSRGEIPSVLGYQLFVIESGSMEPTLKIGAVIISNKVEDPYELRVNDIVTFRSISRAIITHRIIEVVINEDGSKAYRTKGDNPKNSADQELLTPDRVISLFVAKIPLT
ncbi:signal peptidase I [Desulfosporosinus sp.]|uniref:signal peptidase I n=1 Tax=Desulfosporosinus sp. TaxID=157907 RepID=UPI000E9A428E|nr:signal peptidase I [Desulfosporosinus sp.]MBC2725416.1 signal peptidase I [Desulfosporosinus sp.]HBV88802.1 signal peptidase I [Desulfosporosinus sp.]